MDIPLYGRAVPGHRHGGPSALLVQTMRTTVAVLTTRPREVDHSQAGTSSLLGFSTRACFPRIAPATCANDAPPETVANRSAPMACGPIVDQAGRPDPNGLRSDARIGVPRLLTTPGVRGMHPPVTCRRGPVGVCRHSWPHAGGSRRQHIDSPLPVRSGRGPGAWRRCPDPQHVLRRKQNPSVGTTSPRWGARRRSSSRVASRDPSWPRAP
jgi:hypothetical protein